MTVAVTVSGIVSETGAGSLRDRGRDSSRDSVRVSL